ncbi:MAG: heavy-metal-associated domain-containing protein [Acidobacteria bacterium]|nr:heavy-metal-associated domain-containing protein [Acidobacteriota bacterium]
MKQPKTVIFLILSLFVIAGWVATRRSTISADDKAAQPAQLEKITFKVQGMTCGGCALAVKKTLEKQQGVRKAEVSLEKGEAIAEVKRGNVRPEDLADAVTKVGYKTTVVRLN